MTSQFRSSIVRILTAKGAIVGAGFLVSQKHILTCAHVVAQALDLSTETVSMPESKVKLDFPLLSAEKKATDTLTAKVIFWKPLSGHFSGGGDIALLKLEDDPPPGSLPGRPVVEDDLWAHSFRAFGFPYGYDNGIWASGVIRDKLANGWVEIEDNKETGFFVARGFSGTPVWDNETTGIVGMIVSAESSPDVRVAYLIPAHILVEACPQIKSYVIPACPYRGLSAFQEQHAPFFFGRKNFIRKLVNAVHQKPLTFVIGPSGSGKSSVVLAGLIPSLRVEETWLIASFHPGRRPFDNLTSKLVPLLEPQINETEGWIKSRNLAVVFKKQESSLLDFIEHIIEGKPSASSLLLVVDQFEELFTLCQDQEEQNLFLERLLNSVSTNQPGSPLALVLTLRSDFLNHALSNTLLADALQDNVLTLGAMNRLALEEAIVKPAHKLSVTIEDGLKERILEAVSRAPGDLPLLEFALTQMWPLQKKGKLTHTAYDEIGGVEKALTGYAEEKFTHFNEEEQQRIHRIFIQLVHPGEGTEDTRRLATRTEVGGENWDLVRRLADARLIVSGQDKATGEETVQIVHEVLIKGWERLRRWMEEDRTFRAWQDRLRGAMHQWESSSHDEGALLRGGPLIEAEDWLFKRHSDLSSIELKFIKDSQSLREKEESARQKEQAVRQRLRQRVTKVIAAGMLVALILALLAGLGWWRSYKESLYAKEQQRVAEEQKKYAQKQRQLAVARHLAAEAELVQKQHPHLLPHSVLLATEAMRRHPCLESDQALRHGLSLLPRLVKVIHHDDSVHDIAFSPDGNYLATASSDKTAVLLDRITGQTKNLVHKDAINAIVFSPKGNYVATASRDCTAKICNLIREQEVALKGHHNTVNAIAFSPDEKLVVTASSDHTVRVWDVEGARQIAKLQHNNNLTSVNFSPDGKYLATAGWAGTARVFDTRNWQEQYILNHEDKINAVLFSIDGRYLATASSDSTARIRDTAGDKQIILHGHIDKITALAFDVHSQYIATGSWDHTARVWKPDTGREIARMTHNDKVTAVTFSPDGKYLATASSDFTARIWGTNDGYELVRMTHGDKVTSLDFSPGGEYIATASEDGTARIWETASIYKDHRLPHEKEVVAIAFSPDGKYLAIIEGDTTLRLWNLHGERESKRLRYTKKLEVMAFSPDGKYLAAAEGPSVRLIASDSGLETGCLVHRETMQTVAISPNGKYLATAGDDHTVWIRKTSSGQRIANLPHQCLVKAMCFSGHGDYLATALEDGSLAIWDVAGRQKIIHMKHKGSISDMALSAGGKYLAIVDSDNFMTAWCVDQSFLPLMGLPHKATGVAFSADAKYLAVASENITQIWDIEHRQQVNCLQQAAKITGLSFREDGKNVALLGKDIRVVEMESQRQIFCLKNIEKAFALSPEGKYLITAGNDNTIRVWETDSGLEKERVKYECLIEGIAFSPDGKYLAASFDDYTTRVWDMDTFKEVAGAKHEGKINAMAFSPCGKYLATGSTDHSCCIWEPATGRKILCVQHHKAVNDVAFSPCGKYLATAGTDCLAGVWEVSSGLEKCSISHQNFVRAVIFSPDGKYLTTLSGDQTISVWAAGGQKIAGMKHEKEVHDLAFSPNGDYLATASEDRTVRVWNVSTGREVARIKHKLGVNGLAFSPDGKYLATASEDKTAGLWLWRPEDLMAEACSRLLRNFSQKEWDGYFIREAYCKTCPNLE